ncbi:DUF3368 domain-containing protein [Oscillatoria sp. CS-180]|uniref:DUF3368 domain-containing protein n=1 Tax=Oscillatoria sp. CS-180 TaxID=3021720 RepID=UPI00233077E4|nr:DUF3368 domain-containing protein [Oscillatoria sp. CS-180]MDB9527744.1 DUF3368 domain-containing protein [Oscillatoria sp. CS-180]
MIVVSDTSAITNLAAIQRLDLLVQLYEQVTIPIAVYRELAQIDSLVPGKVEVQSAQWLKVQPVINQSIVQQLRTKARLDPGESEAIALALELDADLLLIDERRGRIEADRLGIRITGLLGVLVEAKQKKLILAVQPLMDSLIATSNFRISPALYQQILDLVGET